MKTPFDLGIKLLFRLLIPGFFLTIGFVPILYTIWDFAGWSIQREYILSIGALLMGWLLIILDAPIYMLFEGRRFWPSPLRRFLMSCEKDRLERNKQKEDKLYNLSLSQTGNEAISSYQESLEAWVEIRQFPMNDQGHYEARFPSRLGNLITAFEAYPYTRYGMDSVFYAPRIWLKLSKEVIEELGTSQAIADSAVYTSFSLYVNAFLWFIYAVSSTVQSSLIKHLPQVGITWLLFFIFLLLGYVVYRLSIYIQAQYGELFKSVFDIYQKDIDIDQIIETVSALTKDSIIKNVNREEKLKIAWDYLHNYRVQCPRCKKYVSPSDLDDPECNHNIY